MSIDLSTMDKCLRLTKFTGNNLIKVHVALLWIYEYQIAVSKEMTDLKGSMSPQEARSKLRESFLRAVSELKGEACQILTYEQSTLEATFNGWKPDGSEIIVDDLKTPANIIMSSALLRTPDIIAIHFDKNINLT